MATLAAAAVVLVVANADQWFIGDEWEFLVNRGLVGARWGLWYPHNEHWSTIPIIVYSVLRDTVGIGSYWPFVAVLISVHLALAHVIWRIALRAGASAVIATGGALVFALLGAGYENLLWAFQIGFVGSILFGWMAALVADVPDRLARRDIGVLVLLVASLMCSGIGVPMVVIVATGVLLRCRNWLRAAVVGGVPGLVFVVWYVLIGNVTRKPGEIPALGSVVSDVANELVRLAGLVTSLAPGLAASALVVVVGWWAWRLTGAVRGVPAARIQSMALAGPPVGVLFFVMVSMGRSWLGPSRYVYVVAAMAAPAIIVMVSSAARGPWLQTVAIGVMAVVGVHNLGILRTMSIEQEGSERWIRETIVAAAQLVTQQDTFLARQPERSLNPDITVTALRRLVAEGALPASPTTVAGMNGARLGLEVDVSGDQSVLVDATRPRFVDGHDVSAAASPAAGSPDEACWSPRERAVDPLVIVSSGDGPMAFWLEAPDWADVTVRVGAGSTASQPRTVTVSPGVPLRVVTDLPAATLLTIGLPDHGATVCGVLRGP